VVRNRRRRFIRALGWAIGGFASFVAVLLIVLATYLLFTDYPERLRSALEEELTDLSGAPAKIRAISLDIPRYAFSLTGVTVGAPGHEGPVLELESVWGKLRLSDILSLRLQWSELVVDGLTLHLVEDSEAGLSLSPRRESAPLFRVGFAADRVSIRRAVLLIQNEKVPWELEASNLSLGLTGTGGDQYHGRLSYDEGHLRIKDNDEVRASVEADFELVPHEVLLKEARLQSDIGQLLLTGKLAFAGEPRGRFDVTAEGEVGPSIESLFGFRDAASLVHGTATFRGSLAVEPGNKTLAGTLLLPRGDVAGISLAHWKGEVFWDRSLLQVSYAQGSIAGGSARLQLHQPLPVHEHIASVDVDFERASLAGLLRESRGVPSPVDSLVRGSASLSFSATASSDFQGQFEIEGQRPPAGASPGVGPVPLSLRAKGTLSPAGVTVEESTFDTDFLRAEVSGTYPWQGSARLVVDCRSGDLEALDRLQRDSRRLFTTERDDEANRPDLLGIGGSGEARGALTGRLPELSFDGLLAANRLRFAATDLGAVNARLSIARERLTLADLTAHLDEGALAGRADMSIEGPLRERDFDLDLTLSRWPIDELARILGAPFSLASTSSGRVVASRRRARLEGGASLELLKGTIAGVDFDGGKARLSLEGRSIRLDPIELSRGGGTARGRLELDLERGSMTGMVATEGLELGSLDPKGVSLSGTVEGKLELGGRIESPVGAISGRIRNVRLEGIELGEAFVSGNLEGKRADVKVSLERQAAEIVAEGSVRLADDFPAEGRVRWHAIDLAPWLGVPSGESAGLTALSDGVGNVRVPLGSPDLLTAARGDGELSAFVVEGESYRIASAAPMRVHLDHARLSLEPSELAEGKSRLTLGGSMDLASKAIDLRADGVVNLGVLQTLYPALSATGETNLSAEITGSRERPSLTGYAKIEGGSVRLEGFRQALGGLEGRLVFDNRTVRISDLHGVFGSGPVDISGTVGLEGIRPSTLDLTVRGSGVRLRYPEGLVATLEGDLSLVGSGGERMVSGALVLRDAVWSREYDLVSGMLSDREGLGLFQDFTDSEVLSGVRLDVSIRAPGSLKVRNGLAVIDASADLELRGTLGHPVLLGQSEAEHGEIFFLGQRYNITRGKVDFVDPARVEPFVDLTAETRVRSYRVELRLTGTPERFFPELSSDPPLRTVDILRLLAGANEREILIGTEEEELAGVGVASLLTERLSQEVGKRAERLFGLDRFSIDPFLVGQFANPTARVSLGKQITRQLSINYSTNLNATTEAIILIEYTPEGPMSWVLSRDEEGDVGIDVKFRKSF
jgi:TamB, inner membrane protein subunit of TAM complex